MYFDIAFSIHFLVYFVVMSLACFLDVFAIDAISSIHPFSEVFVMGGWKCVRVGGYVIHLVLGEFANSGRFF